MSIWLNKLNWKPSTSFQESVAPPVTQPGDFPQVCVQFSKDWLPYVLGALQQLCQTTTWDVTGTGLTQLQMVQRATELLFDFAVSTVCASHPSCAGMDPAHESSFSAVFAAAGNLTHIRVTAGQTHGGLAVVYGLQDVDVTAVVPGTFVLGVDGAGVVHATAGAMVPGTQVLIATVTVQGTDGLWHCDPSLTLLPMCKDNIGAPCDPFAVIAGVGIWPLQALIAPASFHNSSTPAGDVAGFWTSSAVYTGGDPFNGHAMPGLVLATEYGTGVCPMLLIAQTNNVRTPAGLTSPWGATVTVPSGLVFGPLSGGPTAVLPNPPTFFFPDTTDAWLNGSTLVQKGNGDVRWAANESTGFPDNFPHYALACSPIYLTVTPHLSTC